MGLNIIDAFSTPCFTRLPPSTPTFLPKSPIKSMYEAAQIMSYWGANGEIAHHIENDIMKSGIHKTWRSMMPSTTPKILSDYQRLYNSTTFNFSAVDAEINVHGVILPHDQILFHGGHWKNHSNILKTTRPLSTTFCPQVAMREAEHRGKSYDLGYIDLIYIRLSNPLTKAFVFRTQGTNMGYELEVLFGAGAILIENKRTRLRNDYPVAKYGFPDKEIPSYLVEVTLT